MAKIKIIPHPMLKSRKSLRRWYRNILTYVPENFMDRPFVEIVRTDLNSLMSSFLKAHFFRFKEIE